MLLWTCKFPRLTDSESVRNEIFQTGTMVSVYKTKNSFVEVLASL